MTLDALIRGVPKAQPVGSATAIPATGAVFRSLLSPEDVADIEAGDTHPKTLKAYALSFAEGMQSGRLAPAVAP